MQRRALSAQGLLLGVGVCLPALVAAGLVGAAHPDLGLALVVAGPVLAVAVWIGFGLVLARRRVGDAQRTARLVVAKAPELNLDLLAAVELSRAMGERQDFSLELARAFLRDVDGRVARHAAATLVDPRPLQRTALAVVMVVLGVIGVLAVRGDAVRAGLVSAVSASRVEEPTRREPITGDVELTYRYPAYTGLESRVVPGATGDINAPAGTEVVVTTHADRDVAAAALVVNGARVPLVVKGRELSGSLVVEAPGQYHVAFLRGSRVLAEGPDRSITVEVDASPEVRLLSPREAVELDPSAQRLPLSYEATDDYGLTALELVYRVAGGEERRQSLRPDDGRITRGTYEWDVGALGLRPGQSVQAYLEATDNDAVKGPKKGVSANLTVKLYSAEEHRREALRRAAALWERLVTHLADRLEGAERASPASPEAALAGRPVDERAVQLTQDLAQLAEELHKDRSAPLELAQALTNVGRELTVDTSVVSGQRRMLLRLTGKDGTRSAAQPSGAFPDVGRRLSRAVLADASRAEKNVLYLETLLDRQRLEAVRALAKELQAERRELSRLLEDYARTKDPMLQEALMAQMAELRASMLELRERMAELAKGIRDDFMNEDALQDLLQDENVEGALDEVERLVKDGKVEEAMTKLQELSMQMDELLERLDDASDRAAQEADPELSRLFRELEENLEATVEEQEAVAERTRAIKDKYRQQQKERISRQGEALKRELGQRLDELDKSLEQLDAARYGARFQELKTQAQRELENVDQSLEASDFDLAHDAAEQLEERVDQLAEQAEEQRRLDEMFQNPPEVRRESRHLRDRLQRDTRRAQEVAQKLGELFPPPGQQLSESDRAQLQELAQRQRKLRGRAQRLEEQMDELDQRAPIFNEGAQGQVQQAGERMQSAGDRLQGRDAARGFGEQQGALQALKGLQEAMQEAGRGGKGGVPLPLRGPRSGRGNQAEKVELPDEDPNQAPRDFRKDVMDAMKQGAPDRYRDQNKRYYEELVK